MNAPIAEAAETGARSTWGVWGARWLWSGCVATVVVAELLIAFWSPRVGMGLYLALLLALQIGGAFAPSERRSLPLALVSVPLFRLMITALFPPASFPSASGDAGAALDGFAAAALVLLLVQREFVVAAGPRSRRLARDLLPAIVPLVVVFGAIVARRVAALLWVSPL